MSGAEDDRRSRNHIRRIRHHYLSGNPAPDGAEAASERPAPRRISVGGSEGSPWKLPFALNLALAAADLGEEVRLTLPPHLLAAACRLLGASSEQLGPALVDASLRRAPPLYPRLGIDTAATGASHMIKGDYAWHFELDPGRGEAGAWLYLADCPEEFADPRAGAASPLFLLGMETRPLHRRAINGVWGSIAREQLLHPGLPRAAYLRSQGASRDRYRGFLEALRRIAVPRRALTAGGGA